MKKNILLIIFMSLCAFAGVLNAGGAQTQGKKGYRGGHGRSRGADRGDWAQRRRQRMEAVKTELEKAQKGLETVNMLYAAVESLTVPAEGVDCNFEESLDVLWTYFDEQVKTLNKRLCIMQQRKQGGVCQSANVPARKKGTWAGWGRCHRRK